MKNNALYRSGTWAFDRKKHHRQWIVGTIFKYQKSILKDGKLKKNLCFASLSGNELDEYKWYTEHASFFAPQQYIAIDRDSIDMDKASEYGVPADNVYIGEMEHILRTIRVERRVVIINADFLCTIKTCMNNIIPLIKTLRNCTDKNGECFLFLNAVQEIMHLKDIAKMSEKIHEYILNGFVDDFFPELDYIPVTPEILTYNGHSVDTTMFSFCLHLIKHKS